MKTFLKFLFLAIAIQSSLNEDPCVADTECELCFPEFPPTIDSHHALSGILIIPHGERAMFRCHKHNFLNYQTDTLTATCENGLFNIDNSSDLIYFDELTCGANYFEDIQHHVDFCRSPYQGRSYQFDSKNSSMTEHLAEVCYDSESGRTLFAHMSFYNKNNIVKSNHIENHGQTSVWGSFGKIFDASIKLDAEKFYSNENWINKMMIANLGKNNFNFLDQKIVATKLLPNRFYQNQNGRVTNFVSNKVLMWKSIVEGNFNNLQTDIMATFKQNGINSNQEVDVYVGTHETLSLPMNSNFKEIYVKPGKKFPVPKYVWTIVHNRNQGRAVAVIVINNPFIGVSEIKNAVLCPSICHQIKWLSNLRYYNNYERTAYGLVYCCDIHYFTRAFENVPDVTHVVQQGENGLLKEP